MKNFFPLIIILIIATAICSSTEEKTNKDENTFIFSSILTGASNFYFNYLDSTVKYVTCPLHDEGCKIAANIQIASEGLKTAGIGQEAGSKILEKFFDKASTEAIKEVAEEKAQKVVYEYGTKTSSSIFKFVPVISSGYSLYNAYNKFKNDDKLGATLYTAEAIVGMIPGMSYYSLIPSVFNVIKEFSKITSDK